MLFKDDEHLTDMIKGEAFSSRLFSSIQFSLILLTDSGSNVEVGESSISELKKEKKILKCGFYS